MIGKIIKWVYKKFVYPKLKEYVDSTDNQWDNQVLEFVDEIIDLLVLKLGTVDAVIAEIDKSVSKDMG